MPPQTIPLYWLKWLAMLKPLQNGVTAVVTSCGRHSLLQQTLESFFRHNSFPLFEMIVVEDGATGAPAWLTGMHSTPIHWVTTGERVGQIAAVDYAYSRVRTPWIFHMEDDWLFYRRGFIEHSLLVLQSELDCLQVWLRALDDTNGHPIEEEIQHSSGVAWRRMALGYQNGRWNGFSFNPGLRRLSDYLLCGGYGNLAKFDFEKPWKTEAELGQFYRSRGKFAAILCADSAGSTRHIGEGLHVEPPTACQTGSA